MEFYSRIYFLPLIVLCFPALSNEAIKIPMDEVRWEYNGNRLECNLEFNNTSYGKFYFRSEKRNDVNFNAQLARFNKNWLKGSLLSSPAPWSQDSVSAHITNIATVNQGRITFKRNIDSLLSKIEVGSWLEFTVGGSKSSDNRSYLVPTIRMNNELLNFRHCQSELPNMSYSEARDVYLTFALGQVELNRAQRRSLKDLHSYLLADPHIKKILIDGHTDNVGSKLGNLNISRQRAELVASKMESLGVAPKKIEVRSHGSRYPIASNATKKGQAENRRVTVRLVRADETVMPRLTSNNDKRKVR